MARSPFARLGATTAIAVVALLASGVVPVQAQEQGQRLSLAERVSRLEQQGQQGSQGGAVTLVNEIQSLKEQNRQLQGQVEELRHQLGQLQESGKAQYIDLDSRLRRLEQGSVPAASASSATGAQAPAAPTSSAVAAAASAAASPAAGASTAVAASTSTPAPAGSSAPGSDATAQAAYNTAFKALRDGDFVQSSRAFRSFIEQYPNDELTPNAYYWLGESYYITQNYPVALETFQKLIQLFPQSSKAPGALLKSGYSQYAMDQTDAATATLKSVIAKYPGGSEAKLAQQRLQDIQLQMAH